MDGFFQDHCAMTADSYGSRHTFKVGDTVHKREEVPLGSPANHGSPICLMGVDNVMPKHRMAGKGDPFYKRDGLRTVFCIGMRYNKKS